jgi:membrane associated rhomboid family serine protease
MGGNIFGSLSSPTAVSVGSGGCIFGLLGAIHIEMICSILHARFRSEFSKQEDNEDNKQEGDDDEEILAEMRNRQETESREAYMLRSAVIVLGLLAGICATTLIELISPNHTRLEKDWSVLYGGMISGMIIGLFWHFRLSMTEDSSKVVRIMHALVILLVLFLSDRFFTSQVEHALQASNAIAKNM